MPEQPSASRLDNRDTALSLYHLLDPEILANPYPLFRRLRDEDPVHWDPFLHAWVVTRYADVMEVLLDYSADRTPTPEQLDAMGLGALSPIARVMVQMMLFMDAPAHTRLRSLAAKAFTPGRVEVLRGHIKDIVRDLIDKVEAKGEMETIQDLGEPLPAIVTCEMLGVPVADRHQLRRWSTDFAEMLGNFQHNPERYPRVLKAVDEMTAYFHDVVREIKERPREGLIHSLMTAEVDGDRLTEDEVVTNCIVTMVGGMETTTNLIGNGLLTLLHNPEQMDKLRNNLHLIPSAVEEMLRYESPSQHTARLCPSDRELGGKKIGKRQAVIAVMAAANRDPARFPHPDRFDIERQDNRHMAFGYAAHYCFGAPLARIEGQLAFEALLGRIPKISMVPQKLVWRTNLGLRGLESLKVTFRENDGGNGGVKETYNETPVEVASTRKESHEGTSVAGKQELIQKYLRGRTTNSSQAAPAIARRHETSPAPLSFAQEQIWLHSQLAPEMYNEFVAVYRNGPLQVDVLRRSLNEIVRRHEAWRTIFPLVNDQPVQQVLPSFEPEIEEIDLRGIAEPQRVERAMQLARERAVQPYDLDRKPPLRVLLLRMEDEQHRLYLFLHHVIFDGFSIYRVFLPELIAIYNAFLVRKPSPLAELAFQYSDFAAWQHRSVSLTQRAELKTYWAERLRGLPVLELATDRPRPAVQSFRGGMQQFAFPASLSAKLQKLSRHENTTLFTILMAGFALLLSRYSRQDDLVIGTVASGRKRSELEALLGCFQNPLALRLNLAGDPTFRDFLAHAREATLGALSHDSLPFELMVGDLGIPRDSSRNPVFQALFSLVPPMPPVERGWDLNQLDLELGTAKFDLDLEADARPDGLFGRLVYATDLFDPSTIKRMSGHLESLLTAIAADPMQKLSALPMMREEEQRQLAAWNQTEKAYPSQSCMHQLFEAQVERTPDARAVELNGHFLTYRELNQRANQLAHFLKKHGVGTETRVGICLDRSFELPATLLAVLKAGGACVPLDPNYPPERLAYILEDSQTKLVLTQPELLPDSAFGGQEVVHVDPDWKVFSSHSTANPVSAITPRNLAYVIYTSGSTGKPRGVLLEHRGLVNHNWTVSELYGITATDRVLQFSSISFDIAIEEIFPTLISGATLVLREVTASLAAEEFLEFAREQRLTVFNFPTAFFHELARGVSESDLAVPDDLRIIIVGGEKASAASLSAWRKTVGTRVRWINTYGPTETSVIVTSYEPDADAPIPEVLPIGRPISNTRVHLLDPTGRPVPVGVPGELHIGGVGLARGYLNRPELTAEKFIPDPFSQVPGDRLYRTGDLARYLPDGNIEFLGRSDDQVKIRGYRVELGEIETVLSAHAGVGDAVVVARQNHAGDKNVVAYVIPFGEQAPSATDLRVYLKHRLPEYMVPAAFVLLENMPKTPNGKVDKRALPEPAPADYAQEEEFVAPSTAVQRKLAGIWEDVLDRRPLGVRHNFFELGGHSLLAARLMHRIELAFGKRLPLAALLQAPTIEQLAERLDTHDAASPWASLVVMQPQGSRGAFFCVHGVGGNVVGFRDLVRNLGSDQPFYAFQPQGLDGKTRPLKTVEAMAELYLQELRKQQPEGPYRIGGYSFGGFVAYEMAQRLSRQGERVEMLALFDTYPVKEQSRSEKLKQAMQLPLAERISFFLNKANDYRKTFRKRLRQRFLPQHLLDIRRACSIAANQYVIEPYSGKVTLFRVRDKSLDSLHDPYAVWYELARAGVELREISGDHLSMLKEPQVRLLAQELRDALDQCAEVIQLAHAGD